jgi:hypothetical protein
MRWLMEPIRNWPSIGKDLTGGGSRRTKAQGQRPRRISNLCNTRWVAETGEYGMSDEVHLRAEAARCGVGPMLAPVG